MRLFLKAILSHDNAAQYGKVQREKFVQIPHKLHSCSTDVTFQGGLSLDLDARFWHILLLCLKAGFELRVVESIPDSPENFILGLTSKPRLSAFCDVK